MKTFYIALVSGFFSLTVLAQNPTLTITLKGNKNRQLLIDNRDYTPATSIVGLSNTTITITDLQPGQHNLEVVRDNDRDVNTTITLRANYDKQIVINANGSITQSETRTDVSPSAKIPMSDVQFQTLLQTAQNEWRNAARRKLLRDAFNNPNNYFTTAQARQLIQLVSAEAHRLELAKASYRSITDPANFSTIYDLLNSTAGRNELRAYVNNYISKNPASMARIPMTDADYGLLLEKIQSDYSQSSRVAQIANAFTNISNYFTTYQVKQLLLLLNDERNRLEMAKLAYRGITDPGNFHQVYDVFSAQASRNDLSAYVRTFSQNRAPMTVSAFNTIYQNIRNQSTSMRTSTIASVFTDIGNFYTTSQARQLILLVSSQSDRLALSKLSYRGITDPANFGQLYDVLSSQASRNELTAYVNEYIGGSSSTTATAMSDLEFNRIYRDVSNRWGLGVKMAALTEIFANTNYHFTTDQAERLIRLVSSETNRLQLAKSAYARIVDPVNFNQLYDVLASQQSRDELDNYVRNSGTSTINENVSSYPARVSMSQADFDVLYNRISNTWGFGAKMSSLTDVFNNESNFFTVAQAEKLIRLVSSESNRLQLAKLAYANITDPGNFPDLYDVFSSQSSLNELKVFVSQQ